MLIVPDWPTQHWYPLLFEAGNNSEPLRLHMDKRSLYLPFDVNAVHPIYHRLNLMCFRFSGK